jgi:N-acetylglucosamine malate deacetylase 2
MEPALSGGATEVSPEFGTMIGAESVLARPAREGLLDAAQLMDAVQLIETANLLDSAQLIEAPSAVLVDVPQSIETIGERGSNIMLSADLADAERVLEVQHALTCAFETETLPVAATAQSGIDAATMMRVAPFAHSRRRTARYRIPRQEKRRLLDRFCGKTGTDAPPRTLLIVAHPDDESIGAGARLAELGESWVTYVTDGSPRNLAVARRHGFETREAYAEQRQNEALAALALAGIDDDRIGCLNIVDGEATLNLVELCLKIADLIDTLRPNVVVTHPYEGGHTDHDATAFAVHLACGVLRREGVKPPAVFEMTSYNAVSGEKVVQEFLPHKRADLDRRDVMLGKQQRELKKQMYACFESQQGVLRDFDTSVEKFRPAPRYVFTRPPHAGVLNYERFGDPDLGRRFREGAEEALRQLRVRRTG